MTTQPIKDSEPQVERKTDLSKASQAPLCQTPGCGHSLNKHLVYHGCIVHKCMCMFVPTPPVMSEASNKSPSSIIGCCGGGMRHEVCSHVKAYIKSREAQAELKGRIEELQRFRNIYLEPNWYGNHADERIVELKRALVVKCQNG